jgi:hypothetical protein
MQELFEFKLGNITMEEYEKKSLELLRYVSYIKEGKVKKQCFLRGFLALYRDKF